METISNFSFNDTLKTKVTEPPTANLPPGRVTDLKVQESGSYTKLVFTAPGADLDSGRGIYKYLNIYDK